MLIIVRPKINNSKEVVRYNKLFLKIFIYVLIFFSVCSGIYAQHTNKDSLLIILKNQKGEDKVTTYYQLANSYSSEVDSMLNFIKSGLELSESLDYKDGTIRGYNELASYWYFRGMSDSSIAATKKSLKLLDNKASKERAHAYSNFALALHLQSSFAEAAEWELKALSDSEILADSANMGASYNTLGMIYKSIGDQEKALHYYQKGLNISEKLGSKTRTAALLANIAQIQKNRGDLEMAMEGFEKSAAISKKIGDETGLAITLMDLGRLHQQMGNTDKARHYLEESMNLSRKIKDHIGVVYNSINRASLELQMKNFHEALRFLDSSLVYSENLNFKEGFMYAHEGYAEAYSGMGNHKKAYEHRLKYETWKDSVIRAEHLAAISELEIKYETEKKEKDILTLSEQKLINEAAIGQQQSLIKKMTWGFAGTFLILLLSVIIYRQYLNNSKQQQLIEVINQTQTEERTRIARDLHDSVGGSLALIKNKLQAIHSKPAAKQKEVTEILETITATSDQVRQIAHNLMPGELIRFGLVPAIRTLIEQVNKENLHAQFYATEPEKRLEPTLEIQLYRIVQEAVQNVLKHAGAKNLYIHLNRHKQYLNLMIEDDGVGMSHDARAGMGIQNIRQRIEILKGTFNMDTSAQTGTTLTIQIPL